MLQKNRVIKKILKENGEEWWLEDKGKNGVQNRKWILCNAYNT